MCWTSPSSSSHEAVARSTTVQRLLASCLFSYLWLASPAYSFVPYKNRQTGKRVNRLATMISQWAIKLQCCTTTHQNDQHPYV
ncbi:hypothetical protein EDC04DRAFT_2731122 [Pisolithus marmoratus]|nr:hypothetical protein EDC04DRAFT_2731122 [Pisolithus marmoratus]